jgi:hypothetical protein
MSDNFTFDQGSDKTGAAKDVGGVLYPQTIATESDGSDTGLAAKLGGITETAPASDNASSGLNGRLQRIAQRLTTLIGSTIAVSGTFWQSVQPVSGTFWQTTQPVSAASLPLPTGAAQETGGNLATIAGAISSSKMAVKAASGDFADGALATIGAKADAKSTATDTTAISAMSVWKQISASVQAIATSIAGTLTVATHAVTQSGTWNVTVNAAIAAGTNIIGKFGIDQTTPGTTNGVTLVPATSGGPTVQRVKAAASTNATSVKTSAGQVYGWALFNNTASAKFFKIYNKASSPTVGTDTPAFTIIIPASGGTNVAWPQGVPLGTGIAFAITGAVGDSDTTSTAADDVHGVLLYK